MAYAMSFESQKFLRLYSKRVSQSTYIRNSIITLSPLNIT